MQQLPAADAAARAVKGNDQRLDRAIVGELADCSHQLLIISDDAVDRQSRDIGTAADQPLPADARQCRRDQRQNCQHSPEDQVALEAPPVDQKVGLERHRSRSAALR